MDDQEINIGGDVFGDNVNVGGNQTIHVYVNSSDSLPGLANLDLDELLERFRLATSHLANLRNTIANTDIHILRPEVNQVIEWLGTSNPEDKLALVTGKPGQGKSVIMRQLAKRLRDEGQTVLGIKADDLPSESQSLRSLRDLQQLLLMPAPIEQCVKVVAKDRLCVVLIDQLDTLALTLNPDEQSLRIVVNLIDRLREIENVKIVVSCRDFEHTNDPVLAGIKIDKSFSVGELQEGDINQVLQKISQPQLQTLPKSL